MYQQMKAFGKAGVEYKTFAITSYGAVSSYGISRWKDDDGLDEFIFGTIENLQTAMSLLDLEWSKV